MIFDRGLDEEPLRLPLVESLMSDGFVNDEGELFYAASANWNDPPSIAKLDRQTREPVWKQTDFQSVSNDYDLTGAALDDGRIAVMRHGASAYINSVIFHWLDKDGKVGGEVFAAQVDRASYRLMAAGDHAVIAYTDDIGDLHVQRIYDTLDDLQSVVFLRQEYQMLDLRWSAISPSGDVYIFTQSGRRDESQPTLCRASAAGESSCVRLPAEFRSGRDEYSTLENFVARDGGVVFAQYGTQLVRFDFPD